MVTLFSTFYEYCFPPLVNQLQICPEIALEGKVVGFDIKRWDKFCYTEAQFTIKTGFPKQLVYPLFPSIWKTYFKNCEFASYYVCKVSEQSNVLLIQFLDIKSILIFVNKTC